MNETPQSPLPGMVGADHVLSIGGVDAGSNNASEGSTQGAAGEDSGPPDDSGQPSHVRVTSLHSLASCTAETHAIPAWAAMRCCGYAFRSDTSRTDRWRRKTVSIDCFWSYSRHAHVIETVGTLMLHYGGVPGALLGCLAAVVSSLVASQCPSPRTAGLVVMQFSSLSFFVVCVSWPSRQRVWLDKACIDQDDAEAKRLGILSIGFYLKKSRSLLILWDRTYLTRLWCVFEIAAYLKLKAEGSRDDSLRVLPSFHASLVAIGFTLLQLTFMLSWIIDSPVQDWASLTLAQAGRRSMMITAEFTIIMFVLSRVCGKQLASVDAQHQQLQEFALDKAECFCCKHNHINPDTNQPIECDRILIKSCVEEWFDDVRVFDDFARKEIGSRVRKGMGVPYLYVLYSTLPWLWDTMGKSAWMAQNDLLNEGLIYFLDGALSFMVCTPLLVAFTLVSFAFFCKAERVGWSQTICSTLMCGLSCFVLTVTWHLSVHLWGVYGYAALACVMGPATVVVFHRNFDN